MKTFKQFREQMVAPPAYPIKGDNPLDLRTKKQKLKDLINVGEFLKRKGLLKP
tara:strand:- start:17 stop:175 length:159 start_codon:yes stop_codon:yes gene_type:complete